MKTIILINGPPRCGKTTLAGLIYQRRADSVVIGFADHLKRCVHAIHFGVEGWHMDPDVFDLCKDQPQKLLGGKSWREAYIDFSESFIKPRFGKEWFGERLLHTALSAPQPLIIVPDSGFREEAEPLLDHPDVSAVHLIHLHREDCDFSLDSRSYISLNDKGSPAQRISNDGTFYHLSNSINALLERILK